MKNKTKKELMIALEDAQKKIALLSQKEERCRNLVENAGDYMWVLDLATMRTVYANQAVERILGFTPKEAKEMPIEQKYPPHSLKIIRETIETELSKDDGVEYGRAASVDVEAYHKEGHKVWIDVTARPIRDENGQPTAILGISRDITERVIAQETIEKGRKELLTTLNSIGDAVMTTNIEGRITRMNPVAEKLTGWSFVEAKGRKLKKVFRIYNAQTREEIDNPVSKVLEKGEIMGLANNTLLITQDGIEYQIADSASPIRDDDGVVNGVVLVFRNISQEYKTLEALKKSEKQYRNIFENAIMGIYRTTPDGEILMANQVLLDMIGYASFEEISKRNFEEEGISNRTEYSRTKFKEEIEKSNEIIGREAIWEGKNGKIIFVNENAKAIRDQKGDILYYEGTVEDITERVLTEKALKESEEKFRGLVEASSDWIWETDTEGIYTYASPQVEGILGYTQEEIVGKTPFSFMPFEEGKRVRKVFDKLIQKAQPIISLEHINRHKNGEYLVLETNSLPFFDVDGQLLGYRGIDRDITVRKEVERERENLLNDLAHRSRLLKTAANVSKSILSILSLDELLEETARQIRKDFSYYYVAIFLVDKEKKYAVLKTGTGEAGKKMVASGHKLKIGGNSMIGWSIANAKARIALDAGKDTVRFDNPLLPETRSEMALPLIIKEDVIGGLIVQSVKEAAFTEVDISALETMVDQLAIAIQNAKLYEQAQHEIEERKRAEKLLQESEENFRLLFENSPLGTYIATPEGKILDANQALLDILGSPSLEATKKINILKLPALVENGYVDAFRECIKRKKILFWEFPYTSVWDVTLTLSSYVIPVINEKGEVEKVYTLMENITERKNAEKALRESEERFRGIFDSGAIGIALSGSDRKFVTVNPRYCQMFGYTEEELKEKTFIDLLPPEEIEKGIAFIEALLEKKPSFAKTEIRHIKKNGETLYGQVTVSLLPDVQKNDQFNVLSIIEDITEKVETEKALRKAENYLANVVDSMPSALIGVDAEGKITQWNSEAERVSGLVSAQTLGHPLEEAFPRLSGKLNQVRTAMRTRKVQIDPKKAYQKNGETHYEYVTIYPLIANGIEGAVIRIDDVTEKVQIEELMLQSEKMLSVGGLAAGMAHEINNPLAGMMQTASVMSNRLTSVEMPANQRVAKEVGISMTDIHAFMEMRDIPRMLNAINDSGQRVAEIVDNMLSFARRSDAAVTTIDLVKLLDKTLELATTDYDLKKQYDFKTIKIIKEYEEDLPYVPCEGSKIQQVFLNILRNGAQSMYDAPQKEEASHFILRTAYEKDTNMVRIEIEDNGSGMDEKTKKRIFEPFFTTKAVGEGTGLGLSVSFFIITENHDGTLDVESEPEQGANFIIRLPLGGRPT